MSWRNYVANLVRDADPHAIVVIGKGVAQALHGELSSLANVEIRVVPQPQGCRTPGALHGDAQNVTLGNRRRSAPSLRTMQSTAATATTAR